MTAIFFLLFSFCIVRAKSRRQVIALALVGTTTAVMIVQPSRTFALGIIGAIEAVLNSINGVIHSGLSGITNVRSDISHFYQNTAWPIQLINQAQNQVTQMTNHFRGPMQTIFNINLASASQSATRSLEGVIRNGQTNDFSALETNYSNVYGLVPSSTAASPADRTMTDMDDALAKDNLKTLKETDDAGQMTLGVADQIEDSASSAAPGSAPFLTATAVAASIQSQALTQKLLAAELRQEAARLAHSNALRKRGATHASTLSNEIQQMLQPR